MSHVNDKASIRLAKKGGRTRVRPEPTKPTSVRVSPKVTKALAEEFGSLGNAIYYLYEGLQDFRESRGLPSWRTRKLKETDHILQVHEMRTVVRALKHCLGDPNCDGRYLRSYGNVLDKLLRRMDRHDKAGL